MKHIKQTIFYLVVFVVTLFLAIPVNAAHKTKVPTAKDNVQQQPSTAIHSALPATVQGHVKSPSGNPYKQGHKGTTPVLLTKTSISHNIPYAKNSKSRSSRISASYYPAGHK